MSQPTQDPWGNDPKSGPVPPQQPVQPYSFPQPGYGQPQPPQQPYYQQPPQVYYQQPPQQQGLWNPNGVYGGVPEPKKKGVPWWGWVIVVVAAIILIGGVSNGIRSTQTTTNTQQVVATVAPTSGGQVAAQSNSNSTSTSTSKLGKVGETIALNGYTLTINKVEKSENFDPSSTFGKAKDGNMFLAVDITIGSNKAKGVSSNGLYASLKDSQGYKYDLAIFGAKDPSLAGENDIPVGDKVRGWVTFEVPKTATGFIFEYAQLFESEKIRVSLG